MEFQEALKSPGTKIDPNSEIGICYHHNSSIIMNQIRDKVQKIAATRKMDFSISEFRVGKNEKFIGSMVTQFDFAPQNSFETFIRNINDYLVCLKSDGLRYLLAIFSNGATVLVDRENNLFQVITDMQTQAVATQKTDLGVVEYILDGELVLNVSNFCKTEKLHFQVFDILLFKKNLLVDKDCLERLQFCKRLLSQMKFFTPVSKIVESPNDARVYVYLKDFYMAKDTQFPLQQLSRISPYVDNIDGLIFTKINYPYYPGRNLGMIKWKHDKMNTIDFLIVENNPLVRFFQTNFPVDGFYLFELYVVNRDNYILFDYLFVFNVDEYIDICRHFKPVSIGGVDVEGTIMECSYDKDQANPGIKTFYEHVYDMSSDTLLSLINESKLAKLSSRDGDAVKCLLVAFEQRIDFLEEQFKGNWTCSRIRADKHFPNSLATANNVYQSIFEKNISETHLVNAIKKATRVWSLI